MKKIILIAAIAFVLIFIIIIMATNNDQGKNILFAKATLKIVHQPWTGWSAEQPTSTDETVSIACGQTYKLKIITGTAKLLVLEAGSQSAKVEISGLVRSSGGGYDLRDDGSARQYLIKKGESIELSTPTMDAGDTFTITYIEGSN
jgi:hypothetical protein